MSDEQTHTTPAEEGTEDFAALLAQEETQPTLQTGQIVKGSVIQIGEDSIFVDVRGKGEGIIARAELEDEDGSLQVEIGDEIEATVLSTEGEIRLSRKLLKGMQARQQLEVAFSHGLPVEGTVGAVIKGGYEVMVGGLRAFCPFSQMDIRRVESSDVFLNQTLEFRVTRYSDNGRNIVVSRRRLLEEAAAKEAEEVRKKIVPDAVLPGTVTSLVDFGAFVDLGGGVQGLVHVSELSHSRTVKPAEFLSSGQSVNVKVLKVSEQTGKISLSMKALEEDPWEHVAEQLKARQIVNGRAVRMADFGAFVEVLPGVSGLLHVSEIPRSQQGALKDAVAEQAQITVMILGIDAEKRRVALALAPEGVNPGEQLEETVIEVGSVLSGRVDRVEPFGVFVRLGPGQTGLIPNPEMGTPRGTDHSKDFGPDTEVKVLVLAVEDNGRRIRLSRSKAQAQEERTEARAYMSDSGQASQSFSTTLGDLLQQKMKK
jgi:small subunit ribosomal protein S1